MGGKPDVQRQQNASSLQNSVIRLQHSMTICAEKGNAMARVRARLNQRASEQGTATGELCVCETLIAEDDCRFAGKLLAAITQKPYGSQRDVHRLPRYKRRKSVRVLEPRTHFFPNS